MKQAISIKYSLVPVILVLGLLPFGLQNALALLLVLSIALLLFYKYGQEDMQVATVLFAAFLIRALVAIFDDSFRLLPYAWDDFYTFALQIKENILTGYPLFHAVEKSIHLKSYSAFNSLFLFIFGDNEISIRLFNSLLGALVAARVYRICLFLKLNERTAKIALILTAFWPSFILFSSLNMRDSLITFLSIDMLYRFLVFAKDKRILNAAFMSFELLFLIVLRTQNILVYISVVSIYVLYTRTSKHFMRGILSPLPIIIMALALVVFYFTSNYFDGFLRYLNVEMKWRAVGGSAYLIDQTYNSWFDVLKWAPLRFLYFCFGPFAWSVRNGFMLLAFAESIAFLALFYFSLRYLNQKNNNMMTPFVVLLLTFALVGLASNSLIDSNYGTAIRHKMNYILIFFIFSAAYLQKIRFRIF